VSNVNGDEQGVSPYNTGSSLLGRVTKGENEKFQFELQKEKMKKFSSTFFLDNYYYI
jgi:hypothetical protein